MLLPLIVVIAVIVKLDSSGPVFFLQQRVGRNLVLFDIFKFRTMRHNNVKVGVDKGREYSREELSAMRASFATTAAGDARITRVGKILRRYYLDELPQLLNVLLGDMSLVGPRPDTAVQEVDYTPEQWVARHRVRPGITGPAQIYNPTGDGERRIRLDVEYADNPGLLRDIKILLDTVVHALRTGSDY